MNVHTNATQVEERLTQAVRLLSVGEGDLRERVLVAYVSQLVEIDPGQLPPESRERLQKLRIALTQTEVPGDTGHTSAELEGMSDKEVHGIAHQIFQLYLDVTGDTSAIPPEEFPPA